MWLDAVVRWRERLFATLPESGAGAIESVRGPLGDADAHAVIWFVVAIAVVVAVRRDRQMAWLVALAAWSVTVEWLQPVFATLRQRQWVDVGGNLVGITAAGLVVLVVRRMGTGRIKA